MKRMILMVLPVLVILPMLVSACGPSNADVAAKNISQQAEQFKVARRIVAINGITDKYILEIQGYCSVETANSGLAGAAAVTCKVADGQYKKSYVYLSDNVTFVIQQIDPINVSTSRYTVIFKPEAIIPDIDRP